MSDTSPTGLPDEVPAATPSSNGLTPPTEYTPPTFAPAQETAPAFTPGTPPPAPATAQTGVVYVEAPVPPKKRGNRGIGIVYAILGTVLFALLYAAAAALILWLQDSATWTTKLTEFVSASNTFVLPIGLFLVANILLVLLVNRSGWWAHILGSLVVAIVVYIGTIALLLVLTGGLLDPSKVSANIRELATNPLLIAAAVVAREASIWAGLPTAARGRRVKAKNAERLAAFTAEQEAKRAERAGAAAG